MNKKLFILFSLLLVFFVSCQSNTEKTLTYNLVSEPTTIDPHNFNELVSVQLMNLSLIHISEPTRQAENSYAVFCLKKKK